MNYLLTRIKVDHISFVTMKRIHGATDSKLQKLQRDRNTWQLEQKLAPIKFERDYTDEIQSSASLARPAKPLNL